MEEVPDTDAGVAHTTADLLAPSAGYLLGEIVRKILNPRSSSREGALTKHR